MGRPARIPCLVEECSGLPANEQLCRFAKASLILVNIARRLEAEATSLRQDAAQSDGAEKNDGTDRARQIGTWFGDVTELNIAGLNTAGLNTAELKTAEWEEAAGDTAEARAAEVRRLPPVLLG